MSHSGLKSLDCSHLTYEDTCPCACTDSQFETLPLGSMVYNLPAKMCMPQDTSYTTTRHVGCASQTRNSESSEELAYVCTTTYTIDKVAIHPQINK